MPSSSPSSTPGLPTSLLAKLRLGDDAGAASSSSTSLPVTTDINDDKDVAKTLDQYVRMLDELAASDPGAYQAFLRAQAEVAEKLQQAGGGSGRFFVPAAGFVVQAAVHTTRKVAEEGAAPPEALFLNFVGHDVIQRPVLCSPSSPSSSAGGAVLVDENQPWTAELKLQVPFLVGRPRQIPTTDAEGTTPCHAVDVVVSSWVLREAQEHCGFQAQVVALGMEWLEQETGLRVVRKRPWAALAPSVCRYKGGSRGDGADAAAAVDPGVLPFFIDEAMERQQFPPEERLSAKGGGDPHCILKRIRQVASGGASASSAPDAKDEGLRHSATSEPPRTTPLVTEVGGSPSARPLGKKRPLPASWKCKKSHDGGNGKGGGWSLKPGFLLG